jgi:hypothetical protein
MAYEPRWRREADNRPLFEKVLSTCFRDYHGGALPEGVAAPMARVRAFYSGHLGEMRPYILESATNFGQAGRETFEKVQVNLKSGVAPQPLDLPFPVCCFELWDDSQFFVPLPSGRSDNATALLRFLAVFEYAPANYGFLSFMDLSSNDRPSELKPGLFDYDIYSHATGYTDLQDALDTGCGAYAELYTTVKQSILPSLKNAKQAVERSSFSVKLGTGKDRRKHYIKNIVYVSSKSKKSALREEKKHIEWSHRWEVQGHWMKCRKTGKDREGNYNVKGFTWRVNHEKGKKNSPVVRKLRYVEAPAAPPQ